MALPVRKVKLTAERINAVITRYGTAGPETLVVAERGLQPLLGLALTAAPGSEASADVRLGPCIAMADHTAGALTRPPLYAVGLQGGAGGDCVLATSDSLLILDSTNDLHLLAGKPGSPGYSDGTGGAGGTAQVAAAAVMVAGAGGEVWFSDGTRRRVRRAQRAAPGGGGGPVTTTVTTMEWSVPDYTLVHSLAYDRAADVLYVSTPRSIYRAAPAATASKLELVAGSEEASGCVDGASGRAALFGSICDTLVDSRGRLVVLDMEGPGGGGGGSSPGAVIRVVNPEAGFTVYTLSAPLGDLGGCAGRLEILPGGLLGVYEWGGSHLHLIQLGLEPSRPAALQAPTPPPAPQAAVAPPVPAAAGTSAPPELTALAEEWGAMMGDPWGVADVSIRMGPGGCVFAAHSLVLIARSEYFRRELLPGATAGAAAGGVAVAELGRRREVTLVDADPSAFSQLLRHLYTGCVDFPEGVSPALVGLADRLLLPRLADQLRQQVQSKGQSQQQQLAQPPGQAAVVPAVAAAAAAVPIAAATATSAPPQAPHHYDPTSAPSAPPPLSQPPAPPAAAEVASPTAPPPPPPAATAASGGPPQPPAAPPAQSPPAYPTDPFSNPVPLPPQQQQPGQQQLPGQLPAPGYGAPAVPGYGAPYGAAPPYGYGAPAPPGAYGYVAPYSGAPQAPYGAPSQAPYGAQPQNPYGATAQNPYGAAPQAQYGAPPQAQYGAPPQAQYGAPPQAQYGALPGAPYPPAQAPYGGAVPPPGYPPYGGGYAPPR